MNSIASMLLVTWAGALAPALTFVVIAVMARFPGKESR
jgi:hypothetical protein